MPRQRDIDTRIAELEGHLRLLKQQKKVDAAREELRSMRKDLPRRRRPKPAGS